MRIIRVMSFEEAGDAFEGNIPFARRAILLVSIVFVLGFVLKPSLIITSTQGAASALFAGS